MFGGLFNSVNNVMSSGMRPLVEEAGETVGRFAGRLGGGGEIHQAVIDPSSSWYNPKYISASANTPVSNGVAWQGIWSGKWSDIDHYGYSKEEWSKFNFLQKELRKTRISGSFDTERMLKIGAYRKAKYVGESFKHYHTTVDKVTGQIKYARANSKFLSFKWGGAAAQTVAGLGFAAWGTYSASHNSNYAVGKMAAMGAQSFLEVGMLASIPAVIGGPIGWGLEAVKMAAYMVGTHLIAAGAKEFDKLVERGSRMSEFRTSQVNYNEEVASQIGNAISMIQGAATGYAVGHQNRAARFHRRFAQMGF